jgi:hypothetical protein
MQLVQNPSQTNGDKLNNVRCENRNKKREYLKKKINEFETYSKNKNIRDLFGGLTEFKKGYQCRTNLANDEHACRFPQYFEWVEPLFHSAVKFAQG